jgi:RhoGAP domain
LLPVPRLLGYVTEFGQDPSELTKGTFAVKGIPLLVRSCVNFLVARVQGQVGLFRKAVALQDVLDLKMRFAQGRVDLASNKDPHEVAAFLKLFFREMPSPLLTSPLYDEFVDAGEIDDETERVEALKPVVAKVCAPVC